MTRGRRLGRTRPEEPLRRCIGCREARPKRALLRLAAQDGKAVPDPASRLPGRGAWICRSERCARAAAKGRQVSRALKGKAAEPPAERILEWLGLA